jgi:ADP-dependent NAD(P)H-hydrate dehydratase / NAD(P)H-hydrate epimerase
MKVSTVAEMRDLDGRAIEEYGIKDELLMENAGEAAYFVILQKTGIRGRKFVVFSGLGNNGGDGFVVARKIHSNGGSVKVFILGDPGTYRNAAGLNLEIAMKLPFEVRRIDSAESVRSEVFHSDAVIDAIFGTGLTRDVGGLFEDVIELINRSGKTVFSVDIPSGVHGDTGRVMGTAVRADCTITFGLPKIGNMFYPGHELCGELFVTHISFPPAMYEEDSLKIEINGPPPLPPRRKEGHKGSFGQALFIAGAAGYYGAPCFAALSFLKAGGGYSRLASPVTVTPFIANRGSEIVFIPQKETASGSISMENMEALVEVAEKMDVVVLGPGLSLDLETQELARILTGKITRPLLIDGDGITALCGDLDILRRRKGPTVLTPHLGEMSRITGLSPDEIDSNKVDILQRTCRDLNSVVVLKGAHSLIGFPHGKVLINLTGNSGMATAGSGDVLTGTISAMLGLGLPFEHAVPKGVYIHGLAGDLAAEEAGEDGITARDILEYLPLAVRMDREGLDEDLEARYRGPRVV